MTDAEKLPVLLEHWIEHNASHEEEFRKWVQRAEAAGLSEVAGRISSAAEHVQEATESLRKALTRLRPNLDLRGEHRVSE
jgi:hypothetical protein